MQQRVETKKMKNLLIAVCFAFSFSANAEIVTFNFSGSAGAETVTGYFSLDTGAVPSGEDAFIGASYGVFIGDDAPIVDFGVTIDLGSTQLTFEALRPVPSPNGVSGSFGRVFNNQLIGVDAMGNSVFQDTVSFSLQDLGLVQTPSNPLLSTVMTNDVVTYLYFARLDLLGTDALLNGDGNGVPGSIDFSAATTRAELFVQIGSAVFDNNQGRYLSVGDARATYNLTDLTVQPVPLPLPLLLLGSALAVVLPLKRRQATI